MTPEKSLTAKKSSMQQTPASTIQSKNRGTSHSNARENADAPQAEPEPPVLRPPKVAKDFQLPLDDGGEFQLPEDNPKEDGLLPLDGQANETVQLPQGNETTARLPADKAIGMDQSADKTKAVSDFALPLDGSPGGAPLRNTDGVDQDSAPQQCASLELIGFDLNELEFSQHFNEYVLEIPEQMLKSFCHVDRCIELMQSGYSPYYLRLVDPSARSQGVAATQGLACLNIDHKCFSEKRAYIHHLSTRDMASFQDALNLVLHFIWTNLDCDTVRIDLYHYEQMMNGSMKQQANAELKTVLAMNKKGFKWKTLQNDPRSGVRFQIMEMKRPSDLPRTSKIQGADHPLLVSGVHLYMLSAEDSYIDESFERVNSGDGVESAGKTGSKLARVEIPSCFFASLRHIQAEKRVAQLSKLNASNALTAQLDLFPEDHVLPGVRTKFSAATADDALTDARSNQTEIKVPKDYSQASNAEFCAAALQLGFRIPPYEFLAIDGYKYVQMRVKLSQE